MARKVGWGYTTERVLDDNEGVKKSAKGVRYLSKRLGCSEQAFWKNHLKSLYVVRLAEEWKIVE